MATKRGGSDPGSVHRSTTGLVRAQERGPPEAVSVGWSVVNATATSSLTCEIDAFGRTNVVTCTSDACGSGSQTHPSTHPGTYDTALRGLHGTTVVLPLSPSFVID